MRRRFWAMGIITAVVLAGAGGHLDARQPEGLAFEVGGAAPGSALEIALNGGKIAESVAGGEGNSSMVLDLANLGKTRVYVYVDRCEDGRVVQVQLVTAGNEPPPADEDCERRPAGWFWSDRGRVLLDVSSARVSTPGISKVVLFGGGAAAAVGIGLAAGGGSDTPPPPTPTTPPPPTGGTPPPPPPFDPAGTYPSTTTVKSDPGGHAGFVLLGVGGALTAAANSPLQFSSSNLQNWVVVSGEFEAATGRFNATGRGTVAGFSNVGVKFEGTITTAGALSGDYTMGTGGELPGGQAIVYAVQGQKQ